MNTCVIALASLLADIDTATSSVGKVVPGISLRIERKFGHRTLTHSAIWIAGGGVLLLPLLILLPDVYWCFLAGYATHPFLDTMTPRGVKLFYPFSALNCVFPLEVNNPHRYRIQTGGKMDRALSLIFLLGCLPTFLISREGHERFIRLTQQTIEAAVRDYNEFSRDHTVVARFRASHAMTKQVLEGTFEVAGALSPAELLFRGPEGRLHTLGKDFQADYVAENVHCLPGVPASTSVSTVDLSNQILGQILSYCDSASENYFFGEVATPDVVSLPENIRMFTPLTGTGGAIKMNYATYEDLRNFHLENVYVARGVVVIRSVRKVEEVPPQASSLEPARPAGLSAVQFSVLLSAKESLKFLKAKGDTVGEGEVMARKQIFQMYGEEERLHGENISALEKSASARGAVLAGEIDAAVKAAGGDSLEYSRTLPLSQRGYISETALRTAAAAWAASRRKVARLEAARSEMLEKTRLEVKRLMLLNAQLEERGKAAQLGSEIRSPLRGTLLDIRQTPHGGRTEVIFFIQRRP